MSAAVATLSLYAIESELTDLLDSRDMIPADEPVMLAEIDEQIDKLVGRKTSWRCSTISWRIREIHGFVVPAYGVQRFHISRRNPRRITIHLVDKTEQRFFFLLQS